MTEDVYVWHNHNLKKIETNKYYGIFAYCSNQITDDLNECSRRICGSLPNAMRYIKQFAPNFDIVIRKINIG